jgi:hypothetical protein
MSLGMNMLVGGVKVDLKVNVRFGKGGVEIVVCVWRGGDRVKKRHMQNTAKEQAIGRI